MSVSETLLFGIEQKIRGTRTDGGKKLKGCDVGYALAANSCEGAGSVDACTVTAPDVITAFAISNPGPFLAGPAGFFGLERPTNHFVAPITQPTSEQLQFPELSFRPSAEN